MRSGQPFWASEPILVWRKPAFTAAALTLASISLSLTAWPSLLDGVVAPLTLALAGRGFVLDVSHESDGPLAPGPDLGVDHVPSEQRAVIGGVARVEVDGRVLNPLG